MSTIAKLGGTNLPNLPKVLASIEKRLDGWEKNIQLDGKNIEIANVEQPSWIAYYDQLCVETGIILDYVELQVKKVRAERIKYVRSNSSREYTDTAIQKVIDDNEEFIKIQELYLEVKEIYDKCKAVVEAFKQRSYSLNNIVKIREAELENITIRL